MKRIARTTLLASILALALVVLTLVLACVPLTPAGTPTATTQLALPEVIDPVLSEDGQVFDLKWSLPDDPRVVITVVRWKESEVQMDRTVASPTSQASIDSCQGGTEYVFTLTTRDTTGQESQGRILRGSLHPVTPSLVFTGLSHQGLATLDADGSFTLTYSLLAPRATIRDLHLNIDGVRSDRLPDTDAFRIPSLTAGRHRFQALALVDGTLLESAELTVCLVDHALNLSGVFLEANQGYHAAFWGPPVWAGTSPTATGYSDSIAWGIGYHATDRVAAGSIYAYNPIIGFHCNMAGYFRNDDFYVMESSESEIYRVDLNPQYPIACGYRYGIDPLDSGAVVKVATIWMNNTRYRLNVTSAGDSEVIDLCDDPDNGRTVFVGYQVIGTAPDRNPIGCVWAYDYSIPATPTIATKPLSPTYDIKSKAKAVIKHGNEYSLVGTYGGQAAVWSFDGINAPILSQLGTVADTPSTANGLFWRNGALWVCGIAQENGRNTAALWKDGVRQTLTTPSSDSYASDLCFIGDNTYISGYYDLISDGMGKPCLWINGAFQALSPGRNGQIARLTVAP